jgi:acyl-[acyl-carrier-protein]-phospholipid O-acyltransferase/long-chain-fatty-acid--[acyl-carrier-protein] ligase
MNQEAVVVPKQGQVGLASSSFIGLVVTQFLGALNDNMFKSLVVYIAAYRIAQQGALHLFGKTFQVGEGALALALAIGAVGFLLPFLLFAAPAGFLADRYSKRSVIVATKVAEIIIMVLGVYAIWTGNIYVMFTVLFCMGAQSAFFGPAKLGILPEMLHPEVLSTANGIANLATMVSIIIGTIAGYALYDLTSPDGLGALTINGGKTFPGLLISTSALVGVAAVGWIASLFILKLPAANPTRKVPLNPFEETWRDLRLIGQNRALLRVALAVAFFWTLGALAQQNVNTFAKEELDVKLSTYIGILMGVLATGVGAGSIMAGIWSRGKVEMGMVPLGALGLAVNSMLLYTSHSSYTWTAVWLFLLGFSGGLYDVPLTAFLQRNSPEASRGSIFAASNFLSFGGMLIISGFFFILHGQWHLPSSTIFLLAGLCTLPVAFYMYQIVPQATIRFLFWVASHLAYRIHVHGREEIPEKGGALLVANHVSWLDGLIVAISCPRHVRLIAFDENLKSWCIRWLSETFQTIPINATKGPKALLRSLQVANEAVRNGDLVCIFAEGGISRIGQLLPFQRGLMRIVEGTGAPVIPVYLDELWGSIFSFSEGKFFWKWPRQFPYHLSVVFGRPIREPKSVHEVRQAVVDLGAEAAEKRKPREVSLPRQFIRQCQKSLFRSKAVDSTGQNLTGGQLLMRSLILKQILHRAVLARHEQQEKMVAVLLPPSIGGLLVNAALPLLRRVPVNLNYTSSEKDLNAQLKQCEIRHVLTSRKFMERVNLTLNAELIYLEDFKDQVTALDKLIAACEAYLIPAFLLERFWGLTRVKPDDLFTVVFTSGSTGEPKGVMLSHHNVASNIRAIDQLFDLKATDVLAGVLPFFHSFGFTGTLWTVLALRAKGVYHYNPLDARVIGKLCQDHGVTILMSTPTFLRTYLKRCDKTQMHKLDLVVTGAERLPPDLAQAFSEKFGVQPSEGYGTTELSPVAAVNVPDHRAATFVQQGTKLGTVGRPLPEVTAKVVHPETGANLGIDEPGLLLIKGPNVMLGYLHQPEKTAQVIRDGWYVTGDIARIDEDGFIQITDRQSRFSKIGGEMVPHLKIEELLHRILALPEDEGPELRAVVTAVPDEKKGERLVVIHKPLSKPVEQICQELADAGLPTSGSPAPTASCRSTISRCWGPANWI